MSWAKKYREQAMVCLAQADQYPPGDSSAARKRYYDMYLTYVFLAEEEEKRLQSKERSAKVDEPVQEA